MKGHQIKSMLQNMRLRLYYHVSKDCDYHVSERGVPYVHVVIEGERYQFCYFGKSNFFRIWKKDQVKVADIPTQDEVVQFFHDLKEARLIKF